MVARHKISVERGMRSAEQNTKRLELGDLKRFVAGADVSSRQSDGTTVAAQYARQDITLRPANTDRINGWAEIMTRFGEPQCGLLTGKESGSVQADAVRPTLFIHQRCQRLIETLPALQHDPNTC